jgi:hypothetical protein
MAIPRQPMPSEIARFGHIAAFLREQMQQRGCKNVADLNTLLGLTRGNAITFKWLHARGGPSPDYRKKLAKVFNVKPDFFKPREGGEAGTPDIVPGQAVVLAPHSRVTDVLQFNITSAGDARIRLDVTLPVAQAVPVLRMLLDQGLLLSPGDA